MFGSKYRHFIRYRYRQNNRYRYRQLVGRVPTEKGANTDKIADHNKEVSNKPSAPSEFSFVLKSGELWNLTKVKLDEYRQTYNGSLDIEGELRKAGQWLSDNPSKRKTVKGMPRFLGGWLSRAKPEDRWTIGTRELSEAEADELFEKCGII